MVKHIRLIKLIKLFKENLHKFILRQLFIARKINFVVIIKSPFFIIIKQSKSIKSKFTSYELMEIYSKSIKSKFKSHKEIYSPTNLFYQNIIKTTY